MPENTWKRQKHPKGKSVSAVCPDGGAVPSGAAGPIYAGAAGPIYAMYKAGIREADARSADMLRAADRQSVALERIAIALETMVDRTHRIANLKAISNATAEDVRLDVRRIADRIGKRRK